MEEKKLVINKPTFWLYKLPIMLLSPFFRWKFNIKTKVSDRVKKLNRPFVALGNHASTIDVMLGIFALYKAKKRANVVTGKDVFTWKALKPFLKGFGAIPKNQSTIDLNSIKMMKSAVEQDCNLLLYPEGKTSLDGKNLYYLSPSIGKFVKFLGVDVVMIKSNGAYLTRPRYTKGFRRGVVNVDVDILITKEEVENMSNKEVYEKITNALSFNDCQWQIDNKIRFKSKNPAQNLGYLLYKCPKCGREYENVSDENYLTCTHCGNKVQYTEYGELIPIGEDSVSLDRIDLWYDYQRKNCLEEITSENFYFEKEVTINIKEGNDGYINRGKGVYFIDGKNFGYRGTLDDKPFEFVDSLNKYSSVITKNSEGVDHTEKDVTYRFLFTEKKWSIKVGLLFEANFINHKKLFEKN